MRKQIISRKLLTPAEVWESRELFNFSNFNLNDLCKIFISLNPNSPVTSRKNHFHSFVRHFKATTAAQFGTAELFSWFENERKENDLSERTLAQIKSQLTPLFKWLMQEEIITNNPLVSLRFKRNVKPRRCRSVLNKLEVRELLNEIYIHDPNILFPYIYAVAQTGARRSEIAKLRWEDIDLEISQITLRDTKNGSDRKLKISIHLQNLLRKM